jgi:hypothetical protein
VFVAQSVKKTSDLVKDLGFTADLCIKSPRSNRDPLFFVDFNRFPGNRSSGVKSLVCDKQARKVFNLIGD